MYKIVMGDIDILAYDYCKAKITIMVITIIVLTVSVLKTVYKCV